jgi:hypothetical protein
MDARKPQLDFRIRVISTHADPEEIHDANYAAINVNRSLSRKLQILHDGGPPSRPLASERAKLKAFSFWERNGTKYSLAMAQKANLTPVDKYEPDCREAEPRPGEACAPGSGFDRSAEPFSSANR